MAIYRPPSAKWRGAAARSISITCRMATGRPSRGHSARMHTVFDKWATWARDGEEPYLAVIDALPERGDVLYLHDRSGGDYAASRGHAQYAIAPRLLVDDPARTRVALADLLNAANLS